jgi:hypothetical protein
VWWFMGPRVRLRLRVINSAEHPTDRLQPSCSELHAGAAVVAPRGPE